MRFLLFLSSFFIIPLLSWGQASQLPLDSLSVLELEKFVITATRMERELYSLPVPSQVISKREITAINSVRLGDVLNEVSGLITVPDFGGGTGLQLQGMDSQYILILIDGVPLVGRQAGTFDISRITVNNIEQIEIIKGSSSALYGTEAMGGVVNIITQKPKKGLKANFGYRYGSFTIHDLNASVLYKQKKLALSASANRYSSGGYDLTPETESKTVDPFYNYTFTSELKYQVSKKTNYSLSGRYYLQNQGTKLYLDSPSVLSGENKLNEWNIRSKLTTKYNEKWTTNLDLYLTNYLAKEHLNTAQNELYSEAIFKQILSISEFRTSFTPNQKHSFIGGLGWRNETVDRDLFLIKPTFNSQYVYLQYDANPNEKLNVLVGLRFDNHSEYTSQLSPKLAFRYEFSEKLALRASLGYGFKAPDFRQLYFNFTNSTVGYTVLGYNAAPTRLEELEEQGELRNIIVTQAEFLSPLKPESSVSFNFGIQSRLHDNLSFDLNIFRNTIQNLIDTRVVANKKNGQNVFSYYNVDKIYTQGVDFNTTWTSSDGELKLSGGYQLLFAKDLKVLDLFKKGEVFFRDTETLQSFQLQKGDYFGLPNRSRHMFNIKVFYSIPDWKLNTNIRTTYRSKYGLFDTNSNSYLDKYDSFVKGYFIVDWAINKTFYKKYQTSFGIDNLLDFTDSQNISNLSGRNIYIKLNFNF
jgi:outer membrane receptor for ferrienterochelin and colicins